MPDLLIGPAGDVVCNNCHSKTSVHKVGILRASIATEGDPISITAEGKWLEALVHMPEAEFLNCPRSTQVQILNKIRIQGKFQLTPTSTLAGFQEDIQQPSFTPESSFCGVDLDISPLAVLPTSSTSTAVDQSSRVVKRKIDLIEVKSSSKRKTL